MTLRCWFMDGLDPHHPDPVWSDEYQRALCGRCKRFLDTQRARQAHAPIPERVVLTAPDMTRCLHHDRDDRYTCPECQEVYHP